MLPFLDRNVICVLTRSLKVSKNDETAYMPSKIATKMPCNAPWKNRQAMIAGAKLYMRLPKDLRINVLEHSVPDVVYDFYMPGREPSFMSLTPLAHLGDQVDRLNYTKTLLRNTVLYVWGVEGLRDLHKWLATIDFAPLRSDNLDNGFDGVRHLEFSDLLNLSSSRLPFPREAYNSDGTSPTHFRHFEYDWYYGDTSIWRPVWEDCLALTRLCKNLHTLELRVRLPDNLMPKLHENDNMAAVLGNADTQGDSGNGDSEDVAEMSDAVQIVRLLDLQRLRVLRVLFYTPWYVSIMLSEEKVRMVARWLEDGFRSRGQKIEVKARFEWHHDF